MSANERRNQTLALRIVYPLIMERVFLLYFGIHQVHVYHGVVYPIVHFTPGVPWRHLVKGLEGSPVVTVSEGGEFDDVYPGAAAGDGGHCGVGFVISLINGTQVLGAGRDG